MDHPTTQARKRPGGGAFCCPTAGLFGDVEQEQGQRFTATTIIAHTITQQVARIALNMVTSAVIGLAGAVQSCHG